MARGTLYALRSQGGAPPAFRVGKHLLHRRSDSLMWLEAHGEPAAGRERQVSRPPLPVGTAGNVSVKEVGPGKHRALCRYRDHDGRTRQVEAWGATPTAARRALAIAVRDRSAPSSTTVTASTRLADLGELWLTQKAKSKLEPQTVDMYSSAWRIIHPAMGMLRVTEVTPEAVDRFLGTVKPGRILHVKLVLTGVMELAVRRGAVQANPVTSAQVIATVRE